MAEKTVKKAKAAKEPRTYYIATGRRKTAVARVRITEGKGTILINDRPLDEYFVEDKDRGAVMGPLKVTDQVGRVDVFVLAHGGGTTGQAGAVCQGIARAIKTMFSPPDMQKRYVFHKTTVVEAYVDEKRAREMAKAPPPPPPPKPVIGPDGMIIPQAAPAEPADPAVGMIKKIRDSGFLTRYARMKERKKYGLRGARRGTQFSKR